MQRLYVLFVLLTCCCIHPSLHADQDVFVHISKDSPLLPIYLFPLESENCGYNSSYCKELEQVIQFDLTYSGFFSTPSQSQEKTLRTSLKNISYDAPLETPLLENERISYVFRFALHPSELKLKIFEVFSKREHIIDQIQLSGTVSQDRRIVHLIVDKIIELLFHEKGVASSKILFVNSQRHEKKNTDDVYVTAEVYEADWDGKNVRKITHENALCAHPMYVPGRDNRKSNACVFVSYAKGQPKLYLADLKTGTTERISSMRGCQMTPGISPDGTKLGFACDVMGTSDLFFIPFDIKTNTLQKPRHLFCAKGSANASPTFSPDGKKVAFVSNKDGSAKVYIMDIPKDGSKTKDLKPKLISRENRDNTAPAWSYDGKKIAYSSRSTNGVRQIWIYDIDDDREYQLTDGPLTKENPTWAANSLHLMFNAKVDSISQNELYLINLNQKEAVQITSGPGNKQFPSWEPPLLSSQE